MNFHVSRFVLILSLLYNCSSGCFGATNDASLHNESFVEVAKLVLANSDHAVQSVKVMAEFLSVFLAAIGLVTFVVVLLYRGKVEDLGACLQKETLRLNELQKYVSEYQITMQTLQDDKAAIQTDVQRLVEDKEYLDKEYKMLTEMADVFTVLFMVKTGDVNEKTMHLNKLTQLFHPLAIPVMLDVLLDTTFDADLRSIAAFGLGRYAEQVAFETSWGRIIMSYVLVLKDEALSERIAVEVINSVAKYTVHARTAIPLIINWSKHAQPEVRRVCAEASLRVGIKDQYLIHRLEEMKGTDSSLEVRNAASAALDSLRAHNATI